MTTRLCGPAAESTGGFYMDNKTPMSNAFLFTRPVFILALFALLAVVSHDLLPERRWEWIPASDLQAFVYGDVIHGGRSEAEWIDQQALHLHCDLKPADVAFPPFCGFHVHLNPALSPPAKDLTGFKRVHINIDYTGGNSKLRFYLNEFEYGFSDPEDSVTTAKYMSVYIPVSATREELVIGMEEFTVADWWVNNNDVPRQHSLTSLNNVVAFGVDIAYPSALGEHDLQLHSVTFVGDWISAERWYLGILLLWIAFLIIGGVFRIYYFRKQVILERKKRARLRRYAATLKQRQKKYQEMSMRDQLTGLLNRHGLTTYYQDEIASGHFGWPVGLLLIDIDHFKPINDTYGHNVGDKILQRVGSVLTGSRQEDKSARWGGEEFLVILPKTSLNDAISIAERLRQAAEKLCHPEAPERPVTVSIGVTLIVAGEELGEAIGRADAALYCAKNAGRNCVIGEYEAGLDSPAPH